MNYECDLAAGQHLEIACEGDQTFVSFSSRGAGQQQSQGHGFTTGAWSEAPAVYRAGEDLIIRLETAQGPRFLRVHGNRASLLDGEPALSGAERVDLKVSDSTTRMKPMEPMRPMKPMEPTRPMRPMEMKMGGMHMSMGGAEEEPAKQFCTQCGKPVGPNDRFCASCGHPI
jgi:hypothetical protein